MSRIPRSEVGAEMDDPRFPSDHATRPVPTCRRCDRPLPDDPPTPGFCGPAHRLEARRQRSALIVAGPGCRRCYRGGVFFDWRPDGGRQRSAIARLDHARVAACWCPAGQRLELESGHKPWGYLLDFGLEGEREIAPRSSPLTRCRYGEGTGEE
jgi:hypothetical protein